MYEPLFPINATKKGRKKNFYHVIQNLAHESTKMSLSITTLDSISGTHPGLLSGQLAWVKWLWWSDCSQKVWSDDLTSFALSIKNEKQLCPKVIEVLDLAVVKVRNIHCPGAERNWVAEALGGRKKKNQSVNLQNLSSDRMNPMVGASVSLLVCIPTSGSRGACAFSHLHNRCKKRLRNFAGFKNITWNLKLYIQKCC